MCLLYLLLLISVTSGSGVMKVQFDNYYYENYFHNDVHMTNLNISIVGSDPVTADRFDLEIRPFSSHCRVYFEDVPFFKDPFSLRFTSGPLFIDFYMWDGSNRLIDHMNESISLATESEDSHDWDKQWIFKKYYPNRFFYYYLEMICDEHFTGDECRDCEENHYTSTCEVYCKAVANRYTCGSDGLRECLGNWKQPDCDTCAIGWTGQNCDTCALGWTGQKCDTCAIGWTGQNCDTCALEWSGEKCDTCALGWSGEKCDTCALGWTGENCDTDISGICHHYPIICYKIGEIVAIAGTISAGVIALVAAVLALAFLIYKRCCNRGGKSGPSRKFPLTKVFTGKRKTQKNTTNEEEEEEERYCDALGNPAAHTYSEHL